MHSLTWRLWLNYTHDDQISAKENICREMKNITHVYQNKTSRLNLHSFLNFDKTAALHK